MRPSSVLLFDLGGVLVQTRGFDSLKALIAESPGAEPLDDQRLRDKWLSSPSVRAFELGRIETAVFTARFVEEWALPVSPEAFEQDSMAWIEQPYPGAEELLGTLRPDHHLCCLSNCNELHWSMMAPLLRHFDSCFSSHLLGQIKPDQAAFLAVLAALGVEPAAVRFFDDSRANVLGARQLGVRSFLVRGPGEVRTVLGEEGLL